MRLSKVARELNIGITTIFDFLEEKGVEIEKSPNSKISGDIYELLLDEFQAEKAVKEESMLLGLEQTEKETIIMTEAEKPALPEKEAEEIVVTDVQSTPSTEAKEEEKPRKKVAVQIVGKIDVTKDKKGNKKEEEKEEKEEKDKKPDETDKSETKSSEDKPAKKPDGEEEVIKGKSEKLSAPKVVELLCYLRK